MCGGHFLSSGKAHDGAAPRRDLRQAPHALLRLLLLLRASVPLTNLFQDNFKGTA
jgi:hypothetical protein